jgi:putative PIN family toxin of toxin-antitoxin system
VLKVVIDTNLLIDGASDYHNFGNRIIDLVIAGQIEAYVNAKTLRENRFLSQKKIEDLGYLKKLEYFFDIVKPIGHINALNVVEDRDDNKILESAVASNADYLITSDKHLLKLETFRNVKIIRPDTFWQVWEEEGDRGWLTWINNFIK